MHRIIVNDIEVDVVRKDIKNLHLAVYPPDGRVRVAVPLYIEDEAVRLAVINKLPWIKRQQRRFSEQERQTEREYVAGESHYFQGQRYLLHVEFAEQAPSVKIRNKKIIELTVRPGSDVTQRGRVLVEWYREELKQIAAPLVEKWQPIIGVSVADWRIKQMKTKWGSCNVEARRIWLNLELAKKPVQCVEYIIVHEMVHLHERHHNERFIQLMNEHLPNWRTLRDELNRAPLAYHDWTC